jgi:hypothetical protein
MVLNAVKNLYYYKLEEATELRKKYLPWIGKEAHIGRGIKSVLTNIYIREIKSVSAPASEKNYLVEFEFDSKKFSALEFLFHNSLFPESKNNIVKTSSPEPAA